MIMHDNHPEDYPLLEFEGEIILVQNERHLEYAHERLSEYLDQKEINGEIPAVGFDTETRPSFTRGTNYQVALIQIATDHLAILVRTHFVSLPPLLHYLLESSNILKAGLASHDDVKAIKKLDPSLDCQNVVDISQLAKIRGYTQLGLNNLCQSVLNRRVSKKSKLTNWENEKLTSEQLLYAATDAYVTLKIYQELMRTQGL